MKSELAFLYCLIAIVIGCNDSMDAPAESATPRGVTPVAETSEIELSAAMETPEEVDGQQEAQDPKVEESDTPSGILNRATDLFSKTKRTGAAGDVAKKWLSDKLQDAGDSGGETAEDAAKWANDTYKSLKKQGLTTASDAGQWLSDDIQNMNAWKYKVEAIDFSQPEDAERQMNKLGKDGWECFHVSEQKGKTIFFFKKSKKSYLKNIPVKDMLKLIPLMGGGSDE